MKIYHKADGKELNRDPTDARELLATGAYSEQPVTDEEMEAHAAKLAGGDEVAADVTGKLWGDGDTKAATKAEPKVAAKKHPK